MSDYLTGVEAYEIDAVEAVLDATPASSDVVYKETIALSERSVAAVAAMRAGAGGGGGSQTVESDTDPGAVGAGTLWINTTAIAGTSDRPLLIRNAADDGWVPVGLAHYDGAGMLRGIVTMTDSGVVMEKYNDVGNLIGFLLFADDKLYISTFELPIWISTQLGGTTWGISAPSGAEKFGGITEPDDSEVATFRTRVHWFDATDDAAALRFKQRDNGGTVTAGKAAAMTSDGASFSGVDKVSLTVGDAAEIMAALVTLGLVTDDT